VFAAAAAGPPATVPPIASGDGFGAGATSAARWDSVEEKGEAAEAETRRMLAPATKATATIPVLRPLNDIHELHLRECAQRGSCSDRGALRVPARRP
jgi:hypothetical protein